MTGGRKKAWKMDTKSFHPSSLGTTKPFRPPMMASPGRVGFSDIPPLITPTARGATAETTPGFDIASSSTTSCSHSPASHASNFSVVGAGTKCRRARARNESKMDSYESTVPKKPWSRALRTLVVIGASPITAESEKEKILAR